MRKAEASKSRVVSMATGEAPRFTQVAAADGKAPNVTRERMYIEAVEQVLGKSRKVVIDSKSGNGNMLYLPLDKLMERRGDADGGTVTVRPPVTVEPDPSSAADPRQRVER